MARNVADIRNIAFCGHGHAGKTTLVDQMLVASGAVKGNPSVDAGTSICDFDEEEKQHKYSIEASVVHFDHAGKRFNIIDTPGYPDLVGQMIGALRAVETARDRDRRPLGHQGQHPPRLAGGRQGGLRPDHRAHQARHGQHRPPGLVATDPRSLRQRLRAAERADRRWATRSKAWSARSTRRQTPQGAVIDPASISESLIESIIEVDEAVMERYFEGELPTAEELSKLLVQAIAAGTLTPIVCTSVKKGVGVAELMDILASAALPPDGRRPQGA